MYIVPRRLSLVPFFDHADMVVETWESTKLRWCFWCRRSVTFTFFRPQNSIFKSLGPQNAFATRAQPVCSTIGHSPLLLFECPLSGYCVVTKHDAHAIAPDPNALPVYSSQCVIPLSLLQSIRLRSPSRTRPNRIYAGDSNILDSLLRYLRHGSERGCAEDEYAEGFGNECLRQR